MNDIDTNFSNPGSSNYSQPQAQVFPSESTNSQNQQTWQVYHRVDSFFLPEAQAWLAGGLERSAAYDLIADVQAATLAEVFRLTNHSDTTWTNNRGVTVRYKGAIRSTSVGDIITCTGGDGSEEAWLVDSYSFLKLEPATEPATTPPAASAGGMSVFSSTSSSSTQSQSQKNLPITSGAEHVPALAAIIEPILAKFAGDFKRKPAPSQWRQSVAASANGGELDILRLGQANVDFELVVGRPEPNVVLLGYLPQAEKPTTDWTHQSWFSFTFWLAEKPVQEEVVEEVSKTTGGSNEIPTVVRRWYPIEHNLPLTGFKSLAHVFYDGGVISGISRANFEQHTTATFLNNLWAKTLRSDNWLWYGQPL